MKILGRISVFPKLPDSLFRLQELAYNLWWSWNPAAQALFSSLDEELWRTVNQNPVKFLRSARQELLNQAASDEGWLARFGTRRPGQIRKHTDQMLTGKPQPTALRGVSQNGLHHCQRDQFSIADPRHDPDLWPGRSPFRVGFQQIIDFHI